MAKNRAPVRQITSARPAPKKQGSSSSFNSGEEVEGLDYNFSAHGGGAGRIPEPTAEQITTFRQFLGAQIDTATGGDDGDEDEELTQRQQIRRMAEILGRDDSEQSAGILHAIAALCSDNPTYLELSVLPYRVQQAFLGWLTGVFLRPEG